MAMAPESPKEHRSFADDASLSVDAAPSENDHREPGVHSGEPGVADLRVKEQGWFGNLNQNLTTVRNVQER